MRPLAMVCLLLMVSLLGACACQCAGPPVAAASGPTQLAHRWMIGIERVQGDVLPVLPYTNRFLADLAAMPNTLVVYLGPGRNGFLFEAEAVRKLRVAPILHGEGNCMTFTYTVYREGQQQATFGLAVPALVAGVESDPACVDRAASEFYWSLVRQGL
ncbi:MAG TPA: hypothetical protein VLJ20_10315 [Acetobacteraceae bacterium]|nr:hypothetical protein [Acetobacteraceae bacterium]